MIENLSIKNFKCIEQAELEINQLTIFTGKNSSGKSTALQAFLFAYWQLLSSEAREWILKCCSTPININAHPKDIASCRVNDDFIMEIISTGYGMYSYNVKAIPNKNLAKVKLLSADRIGPQDIYKFPVENNFGVHGQFAPSYFDINKYNEVNKKLCIDLNSSTLETQVNYWLNEIVETKIKTEKLANVVILKFKNSDDNEFLAYDTGFGTSLVLPIIISCLSCNIGDTIIIENPEIHLHPKAQAKLADFFAFIANAGVRVILETHCEHLIYKLCYNVYKKEISNENVTIYYKEKDNSLENNGYKKINISKGGRFLDANGEPCKFPSGFFDATAKQYLELF